MYTKKKYDALVKEAARQIREANMEVAELKKVIQKICYRGERSDGTNTYYDWCCEYCARSTECPRFPKCWCEGFEVCIK